MNDFTEISNFLQGQVGDAEKPKPIPEGTYLFQVTAQEFVQSKKKGTPGIELRLQPIQPGDDVDPSELPDEWNQRELRFTFWLTPNSLWRLDKFLTGAGLTGSREQAVGDVVGTQVQGAVQHRASEAPDEDGEILVFAEVRSIKAV